MIKVSAPGKVHFIGEHSVVYGEPAIISTIGNRCYVEAEVSDAVVIDDATFGEKAEFSVEEVKDFSRKLTELWKQCYKKMDFSELKTMLKEHPLNYPKEIIGKSLDMLNIDSGVSIKINSEIPIGSGNGSSAALSVAIARAVAALYVPGETIDKINKIAFETEKFHNGNPSGGDNSTCCYGGMVWFKKPDIIEPLRHEIPYKLENFVLVNSGTPEKTTAELVAHVRNLNPEYRNPLIKGLGIMTMEMREALKRKDFGLMKKLMNRAQENLSKLGVSTQNIDNIHECVKDAGGAAKLSGAGGGGTVICYHDDKSKLLEIVRELGYKSWETELGVEGVRIET